MSDEINSDAALLQVLMKDYLKRRLPRLQDIDRALEAGELLNDLDLIFLQEWMARWPDVRPIAARHPEYRDIITGTAVLLERVAHRALCNEQAAQSDDSHGHRGRSRDA